MNVFERAYNKFFDKAYAHQKVSYSQCGEDLIVDFLLTSILGIKSPSYVDIGAHHPWWLNNTYIFYRRGLRGVNIEPDPALFSNFIKSRPGDININKGVAFNTDDKMADFYVMSSRALNTFSKEEAERIGRAGIYKVEEIKQVELIGINDILLKYFSDKPLDFLSIDVEGLDLEILKSLDFSTYRPKVICVETLAFAGNSIAAKQEPIMNFLLENNYFCYADTAINSIFASKSLF